MKYLKRLGAGMLLLALTLPAQTLNQAETLWKARRFKEANEVFKQLETKEPKNPDKVVLEKCPRIHDLRHTCASWLLSAGVPLIIVSAHLGHEDTSVTAKIYGHLDRTAGQAAAAAMAAIMV